ncbi:ADP-ribosylation factor-like protein 6-interacting protein 6 isoform X3 [Odontesthes bonariensis]|uniref:ADP-ribosylation factor-like protein 6-interacting protein 6 isoform X3 n=1 Tax=Odontesthes bonariensis TaxID=219752 RepID=UPI003F580F4F
MLTEGPTESARRPQNRPKPWLTVIFSVLGSAVAVAAVGSLCALVYPVLKELRAERVTGENGIEERMLGSQITADIWREVHLSKCRTRRLAIIQIQKTSFRVKLPDLWVKFLSSAHNKPD